MRSGVTLGLRDRALVRLATRFPALIRLTLRILVAIPPSRLRTALWRWAYGIGYATSDAKEWDFLRGYLHSDALIDLRLAGPWGLDTEREYRGPDGYIRWFETFTESWSDWDTEVLDVVAPRGSSMVTTVGAHGRGSGSGVDVRGELVVMFTYERGWLTKITQFPSVEEALASLGLERRPVPDLR